MFNVIVKFLNHRKTKENIKRIKNCAIIEGGNQLFGPRSNVVLTDGASRNNVIIKDSAWVLGTVIASHDGKVIFHEHSKIGVTTKILCVNKVEIGAYTAIADNTTICDNNNHPVNPDFREFMRTTPENHDARTWKYSDNAPIIIGRNCWIGTNVRIQKGVTIGDNSVVAACSVVTKSMPANCIAAGNPAKIVKTDIDKLPAPSDCPSFNEFCAKIESHSIDNQ